MGRGGQELATVARSGLRVCREWEEGGEKEKRERGTKEVDEGDWKWKDWLASIVRFIKEGEEEERRIPETGLECETLRERERERERVSRTEAEVVCVTGASGFIGSELVRQLLLRGYVVHATVQDLKNEQETKHLEALEGAEWRLRLFQMDLLNYSSIFAAINGVTGVFHIASPCILEVHDPEKQLLEPAIEGTKNVLKAAKELGVGRVVLTSSFSTIIPNYDWPADVVVNEDCWSDVDYCRRKGLWYSVSKNLAEKAAWEFAKDKDLNMVVVIPGAVFGPILPPTINSSMSVLLQLLQGCTDTFQDFFGGAVHVKDVALAHILVYENKSATRRHLCLESISHFGDFAAKVAELYPEYKLPRLPKDTQPGMLRDKNPSKKLMDLGLQFIPMEQIIKDAVESLKSRGYIS